MQPTKQASGSNAKSLLYEVSIACEDKDGQNTLELCKTCRKNATQSEIEQVAMDVNVMTEASEQDD